MASAESTLSDLVARVRTLEDKEEIRHLIARYAYLAVRARGPELGALFTEDGVFDARAPGGERSDVRVEGRQNLIDFYSRMKPGGTNPMIHDIMVDIDGDTASGVCVLDSPCYTGERAGYIGHYEDVFARVDGAWRFRSRTFFFFQGSVANR